MTKNKNQKKKAAAAQNTTTNLPDGILTPPATPPANGALGKNPQNNPFANGNIRKPPVPWGEL